MALAFAPIEGAFRGSYDWFFHIPRTGGNYTIHRITKGTNYEGQKIWAAHRGHMHCGPKKVPPEKIHRCFTCVRPPLDWYRSFYRFRITKHYVGKNMAPGHPLDKYIWEGQHRNGGHIYPFNSFVTSVQAAYPRGWVTELYSRFIDHVDEVLSTDELTDQLPELLDRWGYRLPLRLRRRKNRTTDRKGNWAQPKKFVNWVKRGHPVDDLPVDIQPYTLQYMEECEHKIIERLRRLI